MELMSSLLFFALCTLVVQVLGIQMNYKKIYHNHTQQRDKYHKQKQISLNMKAPSFLYDSRNSTIRDQDQHCRECQSCMENAIKFHQNHHKYMVDRSLSDEDLHNSIQSDEITIDNLTRSKRSTDVGPELKATTSMDKDKEKKDRKQKYFSVTKYIRDDEVQVLKIKEYATQFDQRNNSVLHKDASTCQIYQVNNSFSCKSVEGFQLLQAVEKKKSSSRKKKHITRRIKSSVISGADKDRSGQTIIV